MASPQSQPDQAAQGQHAEAQGQAEAAPQGAPPEAVQQLAPFVSERGAAAFVDVFGVSSLYAWQPECLRVVEEASGASEQPSEQRNVVLTAPTSAGKSLIGDVAMLMHVERTGKPALLVLPYVSLCIEKSAKLRALFGRLDLKVCEMYGAKYGRLSDDETGVVVCTIERANLLINQMFENAMNQADPADQHINRFSCVVVDELDMVAAAGRGSQLEILLTKLLFAAPQTQLIGMSATLPNIDVLAKWLHARSYSCSFRPVPLVRYIKSGPNVRCVRPDATPDDAAGDIFDASQSFTLDTAGWDVNNDTDLVALLVKRTVDEGHAALVFCGTKAACEITAARIGRLCGLPGLAGDDLDDLKSIQDVTPKLVECAVAGAAYHHANLNSEERAVVENAFRSRAIKVLCATSTLAAGVNLPAHMVIIRHPWIRQEFKLITGTMYMQMAGRAGRAGLDTLGKCVIMDQGAHPGDVRKLVLAGPRPVTSDLRSDQEVRRCVMDLVAAKGTVYAHEIERYARCMLRHHEELLEAEAHRAGSGGGAGGGAGGVVPLVAAIQNALRWLYGQGMVVWRETEPGVFHTSPFGKAVLSSGLQPDECLRLRKVLDTARTNLVLCNDVHLTFVCCPTADMTTDNKKAFADKIRTLPEQQQRVAKLVCGERVMSVTATLTPWPWNYSKFWNALMLHDLIDEMPLARVAEEYKVQRSVVAGLQERAARHATMVAAFCDRMAKLNTEEAGWHGLASLIRQFQRRVLHAVKPEIVELTGIEQVGAATARLLYGAGLQSVKDVATASERVVAAALASNGSSKRRAEARAQLVIRNARAKLGEDIDDLRAQAKELAEGVEGVAGVDTTSQHADAAGPSPAKGVVSPPPKNHKRKLDS